MCISSQFPEYKTRRGDRKSTRLNSSHLVISYAVFCLKKKNMRAGYRRRRQQSNSLTCLCMCTRLSLQNTVVSSMAGIPYLSFVPTRCVFFFFNDTATTEIYTLSLHDALPI